jgi:hypothetical protein
MAKGLYTPRHPEKYMGDVTKIRFMSSWERVFMEVCDMNPNIISWGSEEFRIKYYNPVKKKVCDYIPDFIIKYKDRNGNIVTEVIEIKPRKQSVPDKKASLYDKVALVVNHAKWQAAKAVCESHNIRFRVATEDELFKKKPAKK